MCSLGAVVVLLCNALLWRACVGGGCLRLAIVCGFSAQCVWFLCVPVCGPTPHKFCSGNWLVCWQFYPHNFSHGSGKSCLTISPNPSKLHQVYPRNWCMQRIFTLNSEFTPFFISQRGILFSGRSFFHLNTAVT